ncbi:MAG TPA: RNA polymerase factor sigma-54 [Gammaproteobacteria bacterium]|nr:RNA polymerase factor sigma-54 [Gammaproteobacteria bacterium]
MKASLQLRLGQQLAMTPQLQQAIRLLQLSALELEAEVRQALDSNVMLEAVEDETEGMIDAALGVAESPDAHDHSDADMAWDDGLAYGDGESPPPEPVAQQSIDLRDYLLQQLALTPMSEADAAIATSLIDALNEDGYLSEDPAEIARQHGVDTAEVEAVLHRLQRFDPAGVGARDLRECLLVQLQQLDSSEPAVADALRIVSLHLDLLAAHKYEWLQRELRLDASRLEAAITLIRSLNPRPAAVLPSAAPQYIVPDVLVRRRDGQWSVELNPRTVPRIRVNARYARLIGRDAPSLRSQLQEARWLVKSIEMRNETLLKVARAIVARQQAFLEHGEEQMQPMILRDIAQAVGLHESTVSRVTANKYMHTPRGIREFRYFFSSHVTTRNGDERSSTAIRAMIRRLIADEDPACPLSDNRIASILTERGINVARRTVTKYREAMTIPPSHERRGRPMA